MKELLEQWIAIKEQEAEVIAWRREIEDQLIQRLRLNDIEKNVTKEIEGFKIVASCRIDKKVDPELAQQLASENNIEAHLQNLFRWKAEVNARAWAKADPAVTEVLEQAVTTKIGRPSFKIMEIGK